MKITIPWLKKQSKAVGRVGVAVGPDCVAVTYVDAAGSVSFCEKFTEAGDGGQLLKELVEEHGWEGVPCSLVLHPIY